MATISSTGLGSGLDVVGLVEQLVAAERAPAENRLNFKEADYQAELSALGSVKSALSTFQDSLAKLQSPLTFQSVTTPSSDEGVVTASGSSVASPGSYSIEVATLAKAHTIASQSFTATTDPIGTGTLTFQFGTYDSGSNTFTQNADRATQTVDITSADNSLQGIRDAVNAADIGVKASIIDDGTGFRLVFTSDDSGAANSLKVTVTDTSDASDVDDAGLSRLAYDPTQALGTGKNQTEKVAAQDATFSVNGLDITRPSNTVTGVIEGVTLSLKGETTGTPATITVAQDKSSITEAITEFVDGYNSLMDTLNTQTSYDADEGIAGILLGDSLIRGIESQMRNMLANTVTGLTGGYTSLSTLGITSDLDGKLNLDSTVLDEVLESDSSAISRLFGATGDPTDSLISFTRSTDDTLVGDYAVEITTLATQGVYTSAATTGFPLTVNANNDTFSIKVDGAQSGTISLTQKSYTDSTELAAELQSRINGDSELQAAGVSVTVFYEGGSFVITSDQYGSSSSVEFTAVDTNTTADLGFSVGAGTAGVDVAGTIGGVAATGAGQFLTGTGDADGLEIQVMGGTTGARGTISFTRGVADRLDTLLDTYLGAGNLLDTRTDGINGRIDELDEAREVLDFRMEALQARYLSQFIALDTLLGQLQNTSNFLSQQLSTLPGFTRPDNNR